MAFYKDKENVSKVHFFEEDQYNKKMSPGECPSAPGIYKCQKCGFEDVINRKCDKLPPCSNCNENMTWKLLVKAVDA